MKLVIVESLAKAKTLNKYLGKDFKVIASSGHIRSLPSKSNSIIPEQDFAITYELTNQGEKYFPEIIANALKAKEVYLATDPDREGEAISWHIVEVLKINNAIQDNIKIYRISFNEITKSAVLKALKTPKDINLNLVNAQQARQALDYLVGFTLSPLLWKKLPGCRSAGRVQSVALRLICDREEEIEKFVVQEYWDILLNLIADKKEFKARLTHIDNIKLEKFSITNIESADKIAETIKNAEFKVINVEHKQQKRNPNAPFITSSLQQEAARKLGFSAKKTMKLAQKLYEGIEIEKGEMVGLITYMRTDSVNLSQEAVLKIRESIKKNFGDEYLHPQVREYKTKVKNAQEAHEAIRPTNINFLPDELYKIIDEDLAKLYELIWKRTMACQMASVELSLTNIDLVSGDKICRATGSIIKFLGFYKIYKESSDDIIEEEKDNLLPNLSVNQAALVSEVIPKQHFTVPAPRYTEASLVKKLEELGIGRPSTYVSIISVLQERKYVKLSKKRFFPESNGRIVSAFLLNFFKKYVEYEFTANLENDLDEISNGSLYWKDLLSKFWQGFIQNIDKVKEYKTVEILNILDEALFDYLFPNKEDVNNRICPKCQTGKLSLKFGKYGGFIACSNYPTCDFKKTIIAGDSEVMEEDPKQNNNVLLGNDEDNNAIYLKKGPYGWYLQLGEQQGKNKPKRLSLPLSLNSCYSKIEEIDLSIAKQLLFLPKVVCIDPVNKEEIILNIGKYGPYLKCNKTSVSIKNENLWTIDADKAITLISKGNKKKERKKKAS